MEKQLICGKALEGGCSYEGECCHRDPHLPRVGCGTGSCSTIEGECSCVPYTTPSGSMRTFSTGATRDTDNGKLDFEGFLSPLALQAFAEYMHKHRVQPDGSLRAADNWQKGIPVEAYMKSAWRHFFAVWKSYRETGAPGMEDLCALMFNIQGLLHEEAKKGGAK